MTTLEELNAAGYVTDEFSIWQQGDCLSYAQALISVEPTLLGATIVETLGDASDGSTGWAPIHHFAYDNEYAYDSLGRHSMPYSGVSGEEGLLVFLDDDLEDYDDENPDMITKAVGHIVRHRILSPIQG